VAAIRGMPVTKLTCAILVPVCTFVQMRQHAETSRADLLSGCWHPQTHGVLQILCMHGGLSPELKTLEQIKRLSRPADVPDTGLLCDLLWADPEKEIQGWGENDRGVSYTFGADAVTEFLQKHDLDLICRAHQVRIVQMRYSCAGERMQVADVTSGDGTMVLSLQLRIRSDARPLFKAL
jgi:hypothetical protein